MNHEPHVPNGASFPGEAPVTPAALPLPCIENLQDAYELLRIAEERSRTIEYELRQLTGIMAIAEQRTRTLEHIVSEALYIARYQADMVQKIAADMAADRQEATGMFFRARDLVELRTAHPIALGSNDHLHPDSTTEGIVRPTPFVRHCIEKLGQDIRCLDLGTGGAGLVYEFARNGVLALGVDGSDFNARYRVGYWPAIPENLFTCDITKPFEFVHHMSGEPFCFDVISMWEVLEHIRDTDLPGLLENIGNHLTPGGYFLGSISLLEYRDPTGLPYHVTLQPREWWVARFRENGLVMLDAGQHPFKPAFFCRGVGHRFQDVHDYLARPETGFHFVARRLETGRPVWGATA